MLRFVIKTSMFLLIWSADEKKGFAGQQSLQSFSKTAASVSNKGKDDIKQTNKQTERLTDKP